MPRPGRKNITFSLPEGLVRQAKILAAKKSTSVNALVERSLEDAVGAEDRHSAALKRILASAVRGGRGGSNAKWSREELYD